MTVVTAFFTENENKNKQESTTDLETTATI
jgi:hypothetical protein